MKPQLYDTLSQSNKPLIAEDGKNFRFYCCGPTVYGPAHIGNFRTFLLQDVLRRVLEAAGLNPIHVRNLTDVDDKTIRQSQAENLSLKEFTEKWTHVFQSDCKSLNLLPPHHEPKAVEHIPQQIDIIKKLIDSGHAYVAPDGSVYYKVSSFANYGKLAHFDPCCLKTQAETSGQQANHADEYDRESAADFALWKSWKPEDGANSWDSPWGKGRPGWHIECSAMSRQFLGDTFDLHGGGIDLIFPHHENEIAQSEAASGKPFSHHWFHCAHLKVEGDKMSKSLGNFFTLEDIKQKSYPMALRYALISAHYRQTLNLNHDSLHAAESALSKLEKFVSNLLKQAQLTEVDFTNLQKKKPSTNPDYGHFNPVAERLFDDLNTPSAIGTLFTQIKALDNQKINPEEAKTHLTELANIFFLFGIQLFTHKKEKQEEAEVPAEIQELAEGRWLAKKNRQFDIADSMRQELELKGWLVLDTKDGFTLKPTAE